MLQSFICSVLCKAYILFCQTKRRHVCKYVMILCYSYDFISSIQLDMKIMFICNVFFPLQGQHCLDKTHNYLLKFKMAHPKKNWKFKEGKFASYCLFFFFMLQKTKLNILCLSLVSCLRVTTFILILVSFATIINKLPDTCYAGHEML